jgi:hypothetical protein
MNKAKNTLKESLIVASIFLGIALFLSILLIVTLHISKAIL